VVHLGAYALGPDGEEEGQIVFHKFLFRLPGSEQSPETQ
jgi:hypothetical protein